ncbi:hypothetical protein RRG08_061059 [Elysia crispata]|uniref:Uncharacterized protein n=1 Tax=Elysia crispata TaxID=231223 RepID=A0AAE1AUY0_9GAST|nr:hypothetical protein RRG08_061059 [Elysia crispata]
MEKHIFPIVSHASQKLQTEQMGKQHFLAVNKEAAVLKDCMFMIKARSKPTALKTNHMGNSVYWVLLNPYASYTVLGQRNQPSTINIWSCSNSDATPGEATFYHTNQDHSARIKLKTEI